MNKVELLGRLTADARVDDFEGGSTMARFTLAVDDGKDKNGDKKTQFIPCIAWGKLAEVIYSYTQKGSQICVVGRLSQNIYEKDGVKHYGMDVVISELFLISGKNAKADNESIPDIEEKQSKKTTRRASR